MFPRYSRRIRAAAFAFAGLWIALVLAVLPARAAEPAKVTVKVEPGADGAFRVTAVVVDARGAPVVDARVAFKVRTTFGWLAIAETPTDATGRTQVNLPTTVRPGEVTAEVGDEGQVRATILLGQGKPGEPAVRPGRDVLTELSPQPGFISPYLVPMQVALLGLILGGIWTTYGYVAWLLWQIRGAR